MPKWKVLLSLSITLSITIIGFHHWKLFIKHKRLRACVRRVTWSTQWLSFTRSIHASVHLISLSWSLFPICHHLLFPGFACSFLVFCFVFYCVGWAGSSSLLPNRSGVGGYDKGFMLVLTPNRIGIAKATHASSLAVHWHRVCHRQTHQPEISNSLGSAIRGLNMMIVILLSCVCKNFTN